MLKFLAFSLVFWGLEFAYQWYVLIPGEVGGALVRSFALAGATFFGLALCSSAVFRWKPRWVKYWYVRRSLGVMGFVFIILHFVSTQQFLFNWDLPALFWSLDPFQNPVLFGLAAMPIFFLLAITSFDWAVDKLGQRKWKAIHRLVYFGYLFSVFHFLLINPALLLNPAGYLLLAVTALAVGGDLYWFIRTVVAKKSSKLGIAVGVLVILLWLVFGYLGFVAPALQAGAAPQAPAPPEPGVDPELQEDVEAMQRFMERNELPVPNATLPGERDFQGERVAAQGQFQNLHYQTAGTASLTQANGSWYVVFGEDFATPNGPDLVVYLTPNQEPTQREDIGEGIVLGDLRALEGRQAYPIPRDVNVSLFHSVTIHCRAFNVPWSYAPLEAV
ncbi:MAG: DM13 domain-containing protein [Candidatus Aenigmarchaeota archaeon]|nr:DM13 domain-containing protein [Candidatus Aenigmarchaeota archaeon]